MQARVSGSCKTANLATFNVICTRLDLSTQHSQQEQLDTSCKRSLLVRDRTTFLHKQHTIEADNALDSSIRAIVLGFVDIGTENHIGMEYVIANNLGPMDVKIYA